MSSDDFASNNEDANSTGGRGLRPRISTPAIAQHNEAQAKKADSRARRNAAAGFSAPSGAAQTASRPVFVQQAPLPFRNMGPPSYPHTPNASFYQDQHYGNQHYNSTAAMHPSSSPNPFYSSTPSTQAEQNGPDSLPWQLALMNKQLFTLPDDVRPATMQLNGTAHSFDPEEQDEMFADPDANLPEDGTPMQRDGAGEESSSVALPQGAPTVDNQLTTPENLRTFPQATANMSSTDVERAPPRLIRRATRPSYPDLSSPGDSSPVPQSDRTPAFRQPLIRRTNIFGPGFHDDRQRPRQSPAVQIQSAKENTVHHLSDDDDGTEPAPPKKKSRKEPAARSIVNIDPQRIPVIEKAYEYIYMKVLTDENRTWLQGRSELAVFSQEAVDWAIDRLGLNPDEFVPVTHTEQDLCRERIYSPRKDFKLLARNIIAGPDGFGFISCSSKATKEDRERVATTNRDLVAMLTDKSAFVFENPCDRTVKGSMYKHRSIGVLIRRALFANLLSEGMQYPQFFDDTFPDVDDENQPEHNPTFSLVTIAVAVSALRGAIMEWSSGHFLAEDFSRKLYKSHFDAELKTLRDWHKFTSNPTVIPGGGPMRMAPATFLTRKLQEDIFAEARYEILKDIVAPVPSAEVMSAVDFALNQ
ncbi:hypothetical protein MVEN_02251800 [Mycena venus]|uniref:DUF6532 domain-containing protein n=1 Tax=Mycena venus TaxID=2733690 RepID=A0A8H6X6I7_9AGAR|nr:hypothetical protein MVEN_02251800 [Mycena venus]